MAMQRGTRNKEDPRLSWRSKLSKQFIFLILRLNLPRGSQPCFCFSNYVIGGKGAGTGTLVHIGTNARDATDAKKLCPLAGGPETQERRFRLEKVCPDTRHPPLLFLYPKPSRQHQDSPALPVLLHPQPMAKLAAKPEAQSSAPDLQDQPHPLACPDSIHKAPTTPSRPPAAELRSSVLCPSPPGPATSSRTSHIHKALPHPATLLQLSGLSVLQTQLGLGHLRLQPGSSTEDCTL